MLAPVDDQVVDCYYALFDRLFSQPFATRIAERLRRDAVVRQVQEAAGAASQSLTLFLTTQQLTPQQTADLLCGFTPLPQLLTLDGLAHANATPEAMVETLLRTCPCPEAAQQAGHETIYRVALHSTIQVLMLVAPVMAEWQRLNFSSVFELLRRVINRLNQIRDQLDTLGRSGQAAADERYELMYRDYLLQRFHRVEAGTVRMTTNLGVDLRELFVMPRVEVQSRVAKTAGAASDTTALLKLAEARALFGGKTATDPFALASWWTSPGTLLLAQIRCAQRNVLIGAPGSGKSTFLEWLQLQLAAVDEELVMAGAQAIPLLLRMRQLDPRELPHGAALLAKATASPDRAALMPAGWLERHMQAGRVFFMVDGLDEVEPALCDRYVIPWLTALCEQYPQCRYLVSSRPVGYSPGTLRLLKFTECHLYDFDDGQIQDYTRHWCTAVRLARNELEEEARREGTADGAQIVAGFQGHPYIRDLARNPLMLSAICLANYFEGGTLPQDRALLYKLCVEGLLHHWDQRRGIRSEFGLAEKLRVCREVALAMQADDRAEYDTEQIRGLFANVLGDAARAAQLLEHVRYRTGLLLERRLGAFVFAHLTFQEYLAARAVHEGNRLDIDATRLAREHADGRWREVIALYCGLAPSVATREMIERLMTQPDTRELADVLTEAYLSTGPEVSQDQTLRRRVLECIALLPAGGGMGGTLARFPSEEITEIALQCIGRIESTFNVSNAYDWLLIHPHVLDEERLVQQLQGWRSMTPLQMCELIDILHHRGSDAVLAAMASDAAMYAAPGPRFAHETNYGSQAEIAVFALSNRAIQSDAPGVFAAFLRILRVFSTLGIGVSRGYSALQHLIMQRRAHLLQQDAATPLLASLARQVAQRFALQEANTLGRKVCITALNTWAEALENAATAGAQPPTTPVPRSRSSTTIRQTTPHPRTGRNT